MVQIYDTDQLGIGIRQSPPNPPFFFSTGSGLAVGSACWLVGFGLTVVRTGPDVRGLSAKILPYPFFLSLNSTVPAKGKV